MQSNRVVWPLAGALAAAALMACTFERSGVAQPPGLTDACLASPDAEAHSDLAAGSPDAEAHSDLAAPDSRQPRDLRPAERRLPPLPDAESIPEVGSDAEPADATAWVTICHQPNKERETMTITRDALGGHLGHGDYEGPCTDDSNEQ